MMVAIFSIFRKTHRHRCNEERDLLIDIVGQNAFIIQYLRELHTMISAEVKAILDRAKQNSSLVQSVDLGMKGLSKQVADLQAQISALPAGNVLSDDDKAALSEAASDLDTAITTLQSDIPANTQANGVSAPQGDQSSAQGGDGAPKPLAGTGGPQ